MRMQQKVPDKNQQTSPTKVLYNDQIEQLKVLSDSKADTP
jgi:hypothetical protein